ncbi:MAG: hypothetical protein ACP5IC_02705 [Minisyncoccia bacterium]
MVSSERSYLLGLIIFIIFSLIYFSPVLKCRGYVLNWDSFAHLYFSNVLVEGLQNKILFPSLNIFGGITYFQSFPSLFYYGFALTYFFLQKFLGINIIWNLYLYLITISLGLGIFFLFRKLKINSYFALIFAILIVLFRNSQCCSDFGASNIFGIGVLPFSFSWIWIPFFIGYTIDLLELIEKKNFKNRFINFSLYKTIVLDAVFGALIFYSHFYAFLVIEVFISLFILLYLNRKNYKELIISFLVLQLVLLILIMPYFIHYLKDSYQFLIKSNLFSITDIINRLKIFFTVGSKESLDLLFPWISLSGLLYLILLIIQLFIKRKYGNYFIFLKLTISFFLTILIFIYLIPILKIPLPVEFAYANAYGRFLSFIKYFYLFFSIVGLYWLFSIFNRNKIIASILLICINILIFFNVISSISYFENQCLDLQSDPVSKEFLNINSYLKWTDGGVLISDLADNYYQKFLVPYFTNIDFYPSIAAWWPSIKGRNYTYYLFNDYKEKNYKNLSLWINDFGIDYIITLINENDLSNLNFNRIYVGNIFELWKKNSTQPKAEYLSNLILFIDDEAYFKDFNKSLSMYKQFRDSGYKVVVVPSFALNNLHLDGMFIKAIIIGQISNCSQLDSYLKTIKDLDIQILQLKNSNNRNLKINYKDLSAFNDKPSSDNPRVATLDFINPWRFRIKNVFKEPILLKMNYDHNWNIFQDGKKLNKYLILPQNILIIPQSNNDIFVSYENDKIIIWYTKIIILLFISSYIYFLRKNNSNFINSYEKK